MNKTKNNGITLVALVITVILLLILAGITISSLTNSGLFENAKLAEQKSKEAQEKEDGILGDYENKIENHININSVRDNKTLSIGELLASNCKADDRGTATSTYKNTSNNTMNILIVLSWFSSNMGGTVSEPDVNIMGDIANINFVSDFPKDLSRYMYNYFYTCQLSPNGTVTASLTGKGGEMSYGGEYVAIFNMK